MKARDIARHLESDKRSINAILYDNEGLFQKDPTYLWALIEVEELEICFPNIRFLDCEELENVLLVAGCPASSSSSSISFIMGEKCFVMLEASARLLALCNQLVAIGKTVSVDFTASQSALTYLDRCGFLDHLDDKVTVLPIRPKWSRSRK